MKSARLSFHRFFPWTPMSFWAGAMRYGWTMEKTTSGQLKRPRSVEHPFANQRKLRCLLCVHFNGTELYFSMPQELDLFIATMGRNPLPSGHSLVPGHAIGRPNRHWLSRLPKQAKPWKFRQAVCSYLSENETAKEFRDFYAEHPIDFDFDGVFDSYSQAKAARLGQRNPS